MNLLTADAALGISGWKRNGAAAVCRQGRLAAVVEQGRLSRIRDDAIRANGFPRAAAGVAAQMAGCTADAVALAIGEPELARCTPEPFRLFDHHLAHAATAFLTSALADAVVVVCDTSPQEVSAWRAVGDRLEPIELGWRGPGFASVYSRATGLLGFGAGLDEYRLEALARRVDVDESACDDLLHYDDGGLQVARGFDEHVSAAVVSGVDAIAHMAAAVQVRVGRLLLEFLADLKAHTGARCLALGGGFFFNTYMNRLVRQSALFDHVWVPVNPGNTGLSAGCALLRGIEQGQPVGSGEQVSPFLGPRYGNEEIKAVLDNCKVTYHFCEDEELLGLVTDALLRGALIGCFAGAMEWGPRALGNRSILANPFSPYVAENLNRFLKQRDVYRAYALAVCEEDASAWFEDVTPSPFMECEQSLQNPGLFSELLPRGRRIRAQTVGADPAFLRAVLKRFGHATGRPVLVNTSFNGFHEPIVCSPRDAIRVFYGTGLDVLAIGNFILRK